MIRWRPDTCDCVIEFDGHDGSGNQILSSIQKCAIHTALPDSEAHQAVIDENQSKNRAIGILISQHKKIPAENVSWEMNPDRSIKIKTDLITQEEKDFLNILPKDNISKQVTFE